MQNRFPFLWVLSASAVTTLCPNFLVADNFHMPCLKALRMLANSREENANNFNGKIHVANGCYINCGQLAKRLQLLLGPELDMKEVKLIIFRHKNFHRSPTATIHLDLGSAEWNYHTILFFRGNVVDLDLDARSRLMSIEDYIDKTFRRGTEKGANQWEDIRVITVPATHYMERNPMPQRPWHDENLGIDVLLKRDGIPLDKYRQELEPSRIGEH
jgi:hypothetical protein